MTTSLPEQTQSETSYVKENKSGQTFPLSGIIGVIIMAVAWFAAWNPLHPLSAFAFVFIWVGFIFTADGLNYLIHGGSYWHTSRKHFLLMFAFSVPVWWLFELFNVRVQNWHYLVDHPFGASWNPITYNLMASLCFSTVLPAVMEIQLLLESLPLFHRTPTPKPHSAPNWLLLVFFTGGIAALILPLLWPRYFFGLIWICVFALVDPLNELAGRPSIVGRVANGDWRFIWRLAFAALLCGFFWEMWNYWSLPKWYYTIPYVGFGKVFEMPILGYSGYLPFGLELYALYQFFLWLTRQQGDGLTI